MITVNWSRNLIDRTVVTGHRVKRTPPGSKPAIIVDWSQTDVVANGLTWQSPQLPNPIIHDGDRYWFGFWTWLLQGVTYPINNTFSLGYPESNDTFSMSPPGLGDWSLTAKAWYFWDFGVGGGDNEIKLDAFNLDINDFMYDDFADVTPDPKGDLTRKVNELGEIDTDAGINQAEIVIARDGLQPSGSFFIFDSWRTVSKLTFAGDGKHAPYTSGHSLFFNKHDVIVSVACYHIPVRVFRGYVVASPYLVPGFTGDTSGVVPVPLGGGGPVGPGDPAGEVFAALRLFQDALLLKGSARQGVLRIAQQTFNSAVKAVQNQGKRAR